MASAEGARFRPFVSEVKISLLPLIFPTGWGLTRPDPNNPAVEQALGLPLEKLEERARNCVTCFLETLFDPEEKGLRHYYRADQKYYSELDSGNFLMAVNYLTIYDMTGDPHLLERAEDCFHWAYNHATETHPMFTWQGGVRDGFKHNELYVKYTGDAFLTCIALYRRTKKEEYLFYIKQFHNFFKQAKKAGFKYKYDKQAENSSKPSVLLRKTGAGYRTRPLCDLVSQRGLVCNQRGSRVRPSRAAGLPFLHCANARAIACRLSLRPLRAG